MTRIHRAAMVSVLIAWVFPGMATAQPDDSSLLDDRTFPLLQEALSGDRAKEFVNAIVSHHRVQGSRGYSNAARYVLQQFHNLGFAQNKAWIESFPADGKIIYQTWQSPPGWSIESGELRMIQPQKEILANFADVPMSVMSYSNPGKVQAELVDVGEGNSDLDYEGRDVHEKLVLATGYGGDVHRLAVLKYGAAAVVCFPEDEQASGHPDTTRYTGLSPRTEELDHVTFGFNITPAQGNRLRDLLRSGTRVVLEGEVTGTGLEFGSLDVVVAVIPGSSNPEQELIFVAHLDHPQQSANNNASGAAAILDIVRSLKSLISEGRIPPPQRTLRFLWAPEFYGTMAYIDAHPELKGPELGGQVLAALNLDMVGGNPGLLHTRLNITWTPSSISSALPDVVSHFAESLDQRSSRSFGNGTSSFNYRVTPFRGGSDHVVFNDGMIRIPAMRLGHWPDYTHHTSDDTPEIVDPVELERSELIAAASLWYLANLSEKQSLELTTLVAVNAQERLASDMHRAARSLLSAPVDNLEEAYNSGKQIIRFALEREQQALNSILYFAPFSATRRLVQTWDQSLENESQVKIRTLQVLLRQRGGRLSFSQELTEAEKQAARWIPNRLTRGPLARGLPQIRLSQENQDWYETPEAQALDFYLLMNFIDGNRSILEIRDTLSAVNQEVSLLAVDHYIRDLAKAELVELRATK